MSKRGNKKSVGERKMKQQKRARENTRACNRLSDSSALLAFPCSKQINSMLSKAGASDPIQYADFVEKVMP